MQDDAETNRLELRIAYWNQYCLNRLLSNFTTEGDWKLEMDIAELFHRIYGIDEPLERDPKVRSNYN